MTDENKYNLVAPAPDLFASSAQIEKQINEKVPEDNEEGMRLGNPVDFAEQFNNTLISAAGAPVDMISWAGRKAMTTVGVSEETAGKWFPKEAFGSSATIKEALNPLDIGSDRKADTLLGHAGNATGEGIALLAGGAGVVQKTKNLKGVVGGLSRSADDALRNNLGGVVAAETIAGAGAGIGRGVAEDNEFGATGAFLTEFSTGALALLSAAGAKKVVVDPLIAKLNNMTQKEALEKLSKEEIAEVIAEGQRVIAKEDSGKIHQETVIDETVGETKPLDVTVGGEKIPSDVPETPATTATPKDAPEGLTIYRAENVGQADDGLGLPFYTEDKTYADLYMGEGRVIKEAQIPENVVDIRQPEGRAKVRKWAETKIKDLEEAGHMDDFLRGAKNVLNEDSPEASAKLLANLTLSINKQAGRGLSPSGVAERQFLTETGNSAMTMKEAGREIDEYSYAILPEKVKAPATPKETPEGEAKGWFHASHQNIENLTPREVDSVDTFGSWISGDRGTAKTLYGPNVKQADVAPNNLLKAHTDNFGEFFFSNENLFKRLFPEADVSLLKKFDEGGLKKSDPEIWEMRKTYLNEFRKMLKDAGHDGVIFKDSRIDLSRGDKPHDVAVLFNDTDVPLKTPKDTPEALATPEPTPAPKTPEVAPEADPSNADEFVALVDQLLTGDRRQGRGIQGTDKVARVFDQYRERLNTVISGLRSGASTMDEASALLDELVKIAPKKFELDNVDAGSLAIRNPDKDPASFQALMTEEKAEIVSDIERLREVINFQKDVGEDFDNIEALRKRILGDVEEAPSVKAEEPKPTSKGTEEAAPKPTASQARIKKLEEETNLLHALVSGEDISQIDGVAGMHPSLKPKGNKTDTKTYEQFLNKRKAELKKAARELQKAEINVIKDRILNPTIYKRSRIDKALDLNFHARTAFGLSAPYSMTAGFVSAGLKIALNPIRDTLGSTLWKGLTLKDKSIARKALYSVSDLAAYYDAFMTIFNKNTYRDTGAALKNRGKNPIFSDGDVRFKEGYNTDGEGNVRELAKQRKQIKRVEAQEGIKNTLNRIKIMDSAANVAMELINLPYTVIGAVDTPFTSALLMGKLRAEGMRAGIDQEVPDLAKFVDEYVDNAFKEQNGRKVWAYKQEYEHIRNQADEALFKNRKLEDDDIRKTWTESMLDIATKHTTAGTISGRMIQSLMWVVSTPSIVVSEGSKFVLSPMLAPLRYVGKGAATLSPNSEFNTFANKTMARDKASFKTLRKEISDLEAKKEEAIGAKQKAVIEKELIQKNDSLKAVETRLEKNKVRMAEMDSKALGNAILATGMYIMFWDMSEKDMITGGGHWMNDDQKRSSNFQPYMLLRDNGTGGHDYRMGEPYRIITSIIADVQTWHEYKEKGMLTEDQLDLTAMIARTIRGILQDSPFTGGVKNIMRLFSPTSAQDTRAEVGTEMLFGMVPTIPNAFKAPKREEQRYFDDRTQTRDLGDRLWQNLAASPAPNLKRDEYGRPKQRNKKNLASAVLRTAKQDFPMSTLREYELDQIIEADNRLGNIIGAITTSYKTHNTKEYWRNGETTMYEDFQVFLQTFENSNGLTMIDEAIEIIQEDDWDELYNNGRLGSLNVLEEIEDIDEAYDQYGGLKGGMSKDSNLGLEKLRDARNKTIKEAQAEFFQQERMEQYLNKDGEHPAQALMNQQQFEKNFGWMPQN